MRSRGRASGVEMLDDGCSAIDAKPWRLCRGCVLDLHALYGVGSSRNHHFVAPCLARRLRQASRPGCSPGSRTSWSLFTTLMPALVTTQDRLPCASRSRSTFHLRALTRRRRREE